MDTNTVLHIPLAELTSTYPLFTDFLASYNIPAKNENRSFYELVNAMPGTFWEESGISGTELQELFVDFANGMLVAEEEAEVKSVEILAGLNKEGQPEKCNLKLKPGEVTCIVGTTGSGKSRLLADIEWLANKDTPTKRTILINGEQTNEQLVNTFGGKLVAQITQNMNFVLDMDVYSFLMLHAQSRFIDGAEEKVNQVINLANDLSGEPFKPETPVTFLSGGQSRALMIADVACIGQAPIVLIDEIENAGVDKRKALELLVNQDKIVLMATHDPLLILLSDKRVVIKNGGMDKIITTNDVEKQLYSQLEELDNTMQQARNFFRYGNEIITKSDFPAMDALLNYHRT